jgi:hypothetical protein
MGITHQELTFKAPIFLRDPPHFNPIAEPHPTPILQLACLLFCNVTDDRGGGTKFGPAVDGTNIDAGSGKFITYFERKWTTAKGLRKSMSCSKVCIAQWELTMNRNVFNHSTLSGCELHISIKVGTTIAAFARVFLACSIMLSLVGKTGALVWSVKDVGG